jgi:hydrogenase/urease accessory protein HupE
MKWIVAIVVLLISAHATAHEVRPAYLELQEDEAGAFAVLWKTPMRGEFQLSLAPEFSIESEALTPITFQVVENAAVQTWKLRFAEPLPGSTIRIAGLTGTMTDALVRVAFADGTSWVQRLTPDQSSAEIPLRPNGWSVAATYLELGIEHILFGIDHLLFVLALLLITAGSWKLIKAITAFTVAHSITLGLATLGFVHVPSPPVEAIIALSIVLVASEIVRVQRGRTTFTAKSPWIVALTFGLLHGFGFAGALSDVGLPQGHIPAALLFFNVGVEAGQLMFVAAVVCLMAAIRRFRVQFPRWVEFVPPYAIGCVAMFWVIERVAGF